MKQYISSTSSFPCLKYKIQNHMRQRASHPLYTNLASGLIDVFGWGALGHAFAYLILATSSLQDSGINPWPSV